MPPKNYDTQKAMDPGADTAVESGNGDIDYQKFVSQLPEEFQGEIEQALAALLTYIHSDEGTAKILDDIQKAKGNEAAQIGISALQAMDAADPDHQWSDSSKVFCGYFGVKEVAEIARQAGLIDLPPDQEKQVFQQAAQNYIHGIIKSKPTPEERDKEAIRIQKEVEPLMTKKMRDAAYTVAKDKGIPTSADEAQVNQAPPQVQQPPAAQQGGLLE